MQTPRLMPLLCGVLIAAAPTAGTAAPAALHVDGNRILDASGAAVRLHGVNVPSLEWGDGEPHAGSKPAPCWKGQSIRDTVWHALGDWHANLIRLPINPDRWVGALGGDANAYRATIDALVEMVSAQGAYINIDVHWSNAGTWGQHAGQHFMPDVHTQEALAAIAKHFADHPAVLIGVYNEPHDVDWDTWKHGGKVSEQGLNYATPGLQAMVETVRQQGAHNVVVVGGLQWAFDLTGLLHGYAIDDAAVVYDAHVYPFKGHEDSWDAAVSVVADRYPVYIGEFGAFDDNSQNGGWSDQASYVAAIKAWISKHGYHYTAWTMAPVAPPTLLSDWCYTPSPHNGQALRDWQG